MTYERYWEELKSIMRNDDINYDEGNVSGCPALKVNLALKNGKKISAFFVQDKKGGFLDIHITGLVSFENALNNLKPLLLLELINSAYYIGKFDINKDEIMVDYSILLSDASNPESPLKALTNMLVCIEEVYPELMRLRWA